MALTKIGTDGVKDDAITSGKIPANAVGSSELAAGSINNSNKFSGAVVNTDQIVNNAVTANEIADEAVTLAKLEHGTSSNNGKFLRANNGADPTFETVNTDLVSDTSPQLGGDLQSNGNDIVFADTDKAIFGNSTDLQIHHNGYQSYIQELGEGSLFIESSGTGIYIQKQGTSNRLADFNVDGDVKLFHNANQKFATRSDGIEVQSSGSNHGIFVKHSNGNVVAKIQNKGSGDEGYLALNDAGEVPSIQMDGEHGRIIAKTIRLDQNNAANELDDYEEGTFTLTLSKSDGSGETSGGTVNYTKIGRWVNCWGQVTFGNASSSIGGSHCYMKGWPFAFGAANSNDVPIWVWNNGTQLQGMDVTMASMSGSTSSTTWGMYVHTYNNAPSITGSQMGNGGRVSLGYSYQA